MVVTETRWRPIGVILVTPRRAGELESHLSLRSGAHQLTWVLRQQTNCSVPSEEEGGHFLAP
jgi:hypothetical protein